MIEEFRDVAEAFSRKALIYDDFGRDHVNLDAMRRKVRAHVQSFLQPGDAILEINAGTGADAVHFANLGYRVHATDLAPGMLAQIEEKIERFNLNDRLTAQLCSFTELERVEGGPFNYLFSNMGGVNCLSDPRQITRRLPGLLLPGATITWVVMPPICPWELATIVKGNFKAARRLSPGGLLANVEGVRFRAYYYTPEQIARAFGDQFRLLRLEGLSVFTPTADNNTFAKNHPHLYRWMRTIDEKLSNRPPFNHWGDFFILTLKYEPGDF